MPKVNFVKSARKDNPQHGIKAGDSYYWWSMMHGSRGVKHYSMTRPLRSQLTNSEFLSRLYDLQDNLAGFSCDTKEEFESYRDELVSDINELKDEQEEKLSNMPEGLQEGPTGQLLQERADALESWADDLENVECDYDEEDLRLEMREENEDADAEEIEQAVNEKIQEKVGEAVSELQNCEISI